MKTVAVIMLGEMIMLIGLLLCFVVDSIVPNPLEAVCIGIMLIILCLTSKLLHRLGG